MSDALLMALRFCLLGLIYLFFFRVLQATWYGSTANVSVRAVASKQKRRRRSGSHAPIRALTLVVLEPAHEAGKQFQVNGEMTIGRAEGCQISLDDTFISQLHARVSPHSDGLAIEDLGSTNGTYLNRERVVEPVVGSVGDQIQIGGIIMELR